MHSRHGIPPCAYPKSTDSIGATEMNTTTDLTIELIEPTVYAFTPYIPGKSGVIGHRVVPVTFKTDKTTGKKRDSIQAIVPVISRDAIVSNVTVLVEAIKVWCEDAQDKIIREAVVSGLAGVTSADLSVEAIAAYMRESLASGRLTGEMLTTWFADNMEAQLTLTLAEKMGIDENSATEVQAKLLAMVEVYKKHIISLSSGRTKYDKEMAGKIMRAFEVCGMCGEGVADTEDDIGAKLISKLRVMMQAPEAVDMFAL